jgi:hypothetical protein
VAPLFFVVHLTSNYIIEMNKKILLLPNEQPQTRRTFFCMAGLQRIVDLFVFICLFVVIAQFQKQMNE